MGYYLSRPKKDKESEDRQNKKIMYGASSMQGWRLKQEDSHNCILDFDEETSLFGVYDGHGGAEVAIYTSEKLPGFIKENDEYKSGDYEKALISAFLEFDDTLTSKTAIARLNEIIQSDKENDSDEREESSTGTLLFSEANAQCSHSGKNDDDDDDDDADYEYGDVDPEIENPDSLRRDASRPLEEVMASYRIPNVGKLIAGERGMKPASPYLRGRRDGAGSSGDCSSSSSYAGECSSSFNQPGPSSSNECSSSTSLSRTSKVEVNGSGDAEAESSVNGEPEQTSSKATLKEQSEEISESSKSSKDESSKSSKDESSTNGPNESLVNGSANVNGDITDEVGTSTKETPTKESPSESDEAPSCSTPSKKKKLALTDLDDSDVVKNFITKEEIDEADEDDSEDETFEVDDGAESDSDDDDDFEYKESLFTKLKRRLCQVAMQADAIVDDDDDDDDDDEESDQSHLPIEIDEEGEEEEDDEEEAEDEEETEEDESDEEDTIDLFSDGSANPGAESGCTAVVALIKNDTLYVANAGDSRCVICKDGKAVDMSEDHKPEDEPERARIEKAGGKVTDDGRVNGGLNLSRALGDHSYKRNTTLTNKEQMIIALPDIRTCKLEPDVEFIVLACDGIWNSMTSQEVVDFIKPRIQSNQKLSSICEELFDACLAPCKMCDGTGCDNMTCIIVKVRQEGDNDETNVQDDSKQTTESKETPASENMVIDSNEADVSESVEADTKKANVSETNEVDSTPAELPQSVDSSQNKKIDENNEAVPSQQVSEAVPVPETEEQSDSSTRLKRCADSTEEGECQAKRQKTDTNVDSS
ncbi:probable protein phosphatase CG10417 [Planococcus citri]|uniref:probable protein phosphatase CG10417 n=1 Tax=Planococcus citri TaxID=170843 RepID=UPI0031F747FC